MYFLFVLASPEVSPNKTKRLLSRGESTRQHSCELLWTPVSGVVRLYIQKSRNGKSVPTGWRFSRGRFESFFEAAAWLETDLRGCRARAVRNEAQVTGSDDRSIIYQLLVTLASCLYLLGRGYLDTLSFLLRLSHFYNVASTALCVLFYGQCPRISSLVVFLRKGGQFLQLSFFRNSLVSVEISWIKCSVDWVFRFLGGFWSGWEEILCERKFQGKTSMQRKRLRRENWAKKISKRRESLRRGSAQRQLPRRATFFRISTQKWLLCKGSFEAKVIPERILGSLGCLCQ